MKKRVGPGESLRHVGPGESFGPKVGPGESLVHQSTDTDSDVEGHSLGDTINRPLDGMTGQPTAGHDGIVAAPAPEDDR